MGLNRRLAEVLSEFARTLVTDFPIQAILDHLVLRIVDVLPVSAAGVTLITSGEDPQYVAASDRSALVFEKLQSKLGEGPCVLAFTTGEAVSVPDLRHDDRFARFAPQALDAGLAAVFTFPLRHGEDQLGALDLYCTESGPLPAEVMAAAQTLADVAAAYLLSAQARASMEESSANLLESSLHDALTGLPNRTLLVQRLEHAVARARRSGLLVAVLFADLDQFKGVNDRYGHHAGDELLVAVAGRLTGLIRPGDTLARLSGDEFVILCEDLAEAAQVEPLAKRIEASFEAGFALSTGEVQVSASVGIAFSGRGDDLPHQLLRDADTAMYQAKRAGGARHGVIDLREQKKVRFREDLNRDLRSALSLGQLRAEYQPIVATAGGRVVGAEALLRWTHPSLGEISPDVTVPLAEQSGLIDGIGRWMLRQACEDRQSWRAGTGATLEVAVNVSVHQLMAPDFAATVAGMLAQTGTAPRSVTLELTESVFIQDAHRAKLVLGDLKQVGVLLALDDFGTGYSSLTYLKEFPVDVVKIDRSFVEGLDADPASRVIVTAIVGLAHGLGMSVVAEGVETPRQLTLVGDLGCDFYQGFLHSRPIPAAALVTALAAETVALPEAAGLSGTAARLHARRLRDS